MPVARHRVVPDRGRKRGLVTHRWKVDKRVPMSAANARIGFGLFVLGIAAGIAVLFAASSRPVPNEPARPTSELVGEVTTVVADANPAVDRILAEAKADERRSKRDNARDGL